jgi:hypothetical protein
MTNIDLRNLINARIIANPLEYCEICFLAEYGVGFNLKNIDDSRSMRCIGSLSRSWPARLAAMVNGTTPYLMRAKN